MTTKTINGKEILFVQVSKYSDKHNIADGLLRSTFTLNNKSDQVENDLQILLPITSGEWNIIGLASNLTEDEWKGIMEKEPQSEYDFPSVLIYKTYQGRMPYSTATQSGQSLLQSLNFNLETTLIIEKK